MDLYFQIGVIFLLLTAFSVLAYFNTDAANRAEAVKDAIYEEPENYSLDSSITTSTFFVDARTFTQWAINAKSQRDVYLTYPQSIKPNESVYKAYMREINVTIDAGDLSNRKLVLKPTTANSNLNSYHVMDQSPKTVDYLTLYSQEAKNLATDKMVTVRTFSEENTGKTIYVTYIE